MIVIIANESIIHGVSSKPETTTQLALNDGRGRCDWSEMPITLFQSALAIIRPECISRCFNITERDSNHIIPYLFSK
jgi:hypothetical protein